MRNLPPTLAASLAQGATTLATCWKILRRDGVVLGFTDHDRDLTFGGVTFAASSGLEPADMESQLGFAVGGGDVAGALVSGSLTDEDLAAGRFDDAGVEAWLVDWSRPEDRVLLDVYTIGEVRRQDRAFVAELRGLAHRLDEPRGRVFQAACSADLGDARCGLDLAHAPDWTREAAVETTDGRSFLTTTGLAGSADGLFTAGRLRFLSGASAGFAVDVKDHRSGAPASTLALWQAAPAAVAPGDRFVITAGCDKSFETCRTRFANAANFRGFPHMPGNDFVVRSVRQGEASMDGGSFFS